MSTEQGYFGGVFLGGSILFVLSSLHYRKCTPALCPQWIYISDVEGRLTCMTNLTNNVVQSNLEECLRTGLGVVGEHFCLGK